MVNALVNQSDEYFDNELRKFHEQVDFFASEGKISAKLNVFYNPNMRTNRDLSVLFLLNFVINKITKNLNAENLKILLIDGFSASGIRAARWLKSLDNLFDDLMNGMILNENIRNFDMRNVKIVIVANDLNVDKGIIEKNLNITLKHPELFEKKVENLNFDELILKYKNFDYVDIDPFGSPNPFIDLVTKYGKHESVAAITSTDTGALTGTHPRATLRKYWSRIVRTEMMHEFGLRILIKKMQMHGLSYDKALMPLLAYYKDHYFRIYFQIKKSKSMADEILQHHRYFILNKFHDVILENDIECVNTKNLFGKIWSYKLYDKKLIEEMMRMSHYTEISEESLKLLNQLYDELDILGFYDLHYLSKARLIKKPIKLKHLLEWLNKSKKIATRTHFSPYGIKTILNGEQLIKKINEYNQFVDSKNENSELF